MSDHGGSGGGGSFCEYCGARIPAGASYCAGCGRPVEVADVGAHDPQAAAQAPQSQAAAATEWGAGPGAEYQPSNAYPSAGAYPYPPSTSGMAIASLVLGLACGGGVLSIIFGHLARKEIRNSGGRKTGDGMALAGLILGYISVAIWVILLAVWIGFAIWGTNQPSHNYYYDY